MLRACFQRYKAHGIHDKADEEKVDKLIRLWEGREAELVRRAKQKYEALAEVCQFNFSSLVVTDEVTSNTCCWRQKKCCSRKTKLRLPRTRSTRRCFDGRLDVLCVLSLRTWTAGTTTPPCASTRSLTTMTTIHTRQHHLHQHAQHGDKMAIIEHFRLCLKLVWKRTTRHGEGPFEGQISSCQRGLRQS